MVKEFIKIKIGPAIIRDLLEWIEKLYQEQGLDDPLSKEIEELFSKLLRLRKQKVELTEFRKIELQILLKAFTKMTQGDDYNESIRLNWNRFIRSNKLWIQDPENTFRPGILHQKGIVYIPLSVENFDIIWAAHIQA